MLERYDCPMPYHAVRTHFLGAMCATGPIQPMKALAQIWSGALPALPSIEAVNEFLGALINGLWNALTLHQDERHPCRLMAFPARATRESLVCLAKTRVEEMEGFLTGVFGDQENLEMPAPMGKSLDTLMELEGIFSSVQALLENPGKLAAASDVEGLQNQLAELTTIAEQEIHTVVVGARELRGQVAALEEKEGSAVH